MEYMGIVWAAVIILAAIVEAMSPQLVSIWFVGGGIAGFAAHFFRAPIWLQVIIAAVVTLVLLLATRPFVTRTLQERKVSTNADRVVGETAVVTEAIDNVLAKGRATVLGNDWTARTEDGAAVPAGEKVTVVRIEGAKLIVSAHKAQ